MAALPPEMVKLVAAGVLMLAFDEPGTISSLEHGVLGGHGAAEGVKEAAGGAAEHLEHGKLIQLHVKTPAGEVFYHLPIGSLIVKHPGPVHGEHSRMLKAGEHTFAIPKHAKTFVPKDTDMTDEKAVNDAAKHVILKSSEGEERHAHISAHTGHITDSGKLEPFENQETHQNLHDDWKELPEGKKPVSFDGKIAAWVPHTWQVHKGTGAPESALSAKWVKDSEGKWHLVHKTGQVEGVGAPSLQAAGDSFLKTGKIVPEHEVPEPGPAHIEPVHKPVVPAHVPAPAPEAPKAVPPPGDAAKINIGGVPVTKAQIHDALAILNKDKSTAVKQPLAHAGHPLAAMDYHGVSKAVLKAHPELKVSKGSKQAHVGQVKLTILHHLAEQAGAFPETKAEQHVTEEVKEKVQTQAKHAEGLTPATHELGGVAATKEDIAAAIKHLSATQSTQINQTLKAKGNPLGKSDYWAIVHAHQKAFPETTKGMKAKPVFIAALQHHLDQLGKEDTESGHDEAVAVHSLVDKGVPLEKQNAFLQSLQAALKLSHQHQQVLWINKSADGSAWGVQHVKPTAGPFYRVAPDHSVKFFHSADSEGVPWEHHAVASTVKALFGEPKPVVQSQTKKLAEEIKPPEIKAPAVEPKVPEEPVKDFKSEPGWDELHSLIQNAKHVDYSEPTAKSEPVIAAALQMAGWGKDPWYAVKKEDGKWHLAMTKPAQGSYGAPSEDYVEAMPDHALTTVTKTGVQYPWDVPGVHQFAVQEMEQQAKEPFPEEPLEAWEKELLGHPSLKEPEDAAKEEIQKGAYPLLINGKQVAMLPAGAQVFHTKSSESDTTSIKYAKTPDGEWHKYTASGEVYGGTQGLDKEQYEGYVSSGILKQEGAQPDTSKTIGEQAAEVAPKPPEPPAEPPKPEPVPEGQVAVKVGGKQVGTVPEGSQIYYQQVKNYSTTPLTADTAEAKYVKLPDGDWKFFGKDGENTKISQYTKQDYGVNLSKGKFIEEGKEPAGHDEAAAKSVKLQADLKTGSVGGLGYGKGYYYGSTGETDDFEKALAGAVWKAKGSDQVYVYQEPGNSKWQIYSYHYKPASVKDYYVVSFKPSGMPELTHSANGKTEKLDSQQLYDAAGKHLVPNSVLIHDDQPHKGGFYYNPKSTKTYLEIQTGVQSPHFKGAKNQGESSNAKYIWHKSDGTIETISPSAAATKLETNTEYQPQVKAGIEAVASKKIALKYASTAKPGNYKIWSSINHGPHPTNSVEIKDDNSAVFASDNGPVPLDADGVTSLLKGGSLLDDYGTTVVQPGIEPSVFHVFGSEGKSGGELEDIQTQLNAVQDPAQYAKILKADFPGLGISDNPVHQSALAFWNGKIDGKVNAQGQKDSFNGLLHELLQVPDGKASDFAKTEPVYLKGLPPGVSKPEDVFTWAGNGMAQPVGPHITTYQGGEYVNPLGNLTSPELADKIKAVSQANGSGKVVGTHVASLSKDQRIAWLQAWRKGDMQSVFDLDAKGGKVSPLHPGAPANSGTHQITWSPWNPAETPSSKVIPGEWSDHNKVTLPKAEIANYVIKAGLEHPEHLSQAELRQWVKSHRSGNQDVVDHLSAMAHDRWQTGQSKLTDTPVWTDHLEPAKSYDIHIEEKKAASSWPENAIKDYVNDNWDKLKPIAEQDTGAPKPEQYATYYAGHPLIQKYMDQEEAKWVAEQSKPVYSTTPGASKPTSSHPIYEITATVPLTGEKTQWFFKPAPYVGAGQSPKYIPDKAHAAATLARLWGFKTPESRLIMHDGKYGNAQRKINNVGDLVGGKQLGKTEAPKIDWSSYTDKQLQAVAKEHVLDWALDNPDGRAANHLMTPDGDIVGIDKEHAWRNFGKWSGVTGDEKADTFSKLVATQLYNAVRNHQISKDSADKTYIAVIHQARRMQLLPDKRMAQVLEDGLKERTDFQDFGKGAKGRSNYIDAIISRKQGLEKDFQGVWGKVYKDAGWTLPEVPQNKLSHGFHAGFSEPTFFDHVMAAKSFGVPAFFAGPHLEDGNFHVWTELSGQNRYVRGEGTLRGGALKAVTKWASDHQEGTLINELPSAPAPPKVVAPVVKPELGWHTKIVDAAKAVSKHQGDQVYTGSWTTAKLADMDQVKQSASTALTSAQHAVQQGPDSALWQSLEKTYGHPEHVAAASKHYLDQIKQVEDAKTNATGFHTGDLPRWEGKPITVMPPEKAAEPKPEVTGVKVELRPATRILSAAHSQPTQVPGNDKPLLDPTTNELHLGDAVYSYKGSSWHITLPTGEVIEVNDEAKTNSYLAHQGRIRFRAVAADGSASLERIRSQLESMGLPMEEAQQHDMELFYWRHLANVLKDRVDRTEGDHQKVWDSLKAGMTMHKLEWDSNDLGKNVETLANSSVAPADELNIWHNAWSALAGQHKVQQWSESHGYMPHQGHYDVHAPDVPNGRPFWYRFDADPKWMAGKKMPGTSLHDAMNDPEKIVKSGGMMSTEARLRTLGLWSPGSSSTSDMEKGSSGVVYTRLNQEGSSAYHQVFYHPRVAARTSTYGFDGDRYGNILKRPTESYFRMTPALGHTNGSNETVFKDAVPILDGDVAIIKAYNDEQRAALIAHLKTHGVTHIGGLPVEDRVVTSLTPQALAKVRGTFESNHGSWFAHPAEAYIPPQAEAISKEHSATETAAEIAKAEEGGTKLTEADHVLGTHDLGAPAEKVNQLFYKSPQKSAGASLNSTESVKVKEDTAARLAQHMSSSTEDIAALAKDANINVPATWGPQRQATLGAMVQVWAKTNTSPIAHAYQQVAHNLFGITKDPSVKLKPEDQAEVDKLVNQHGPVLQDFLKTQYDLTQQDLKEAGITHVTLHRGFAWGKGSGPWGTPLFGKDKPEWASGPVGSEVDTPATKPLSSFAAEFDPHSSAYAEFAGHGGNYTAVKTTVPASLVFSYPRSGMGSYWQSEFIVLDSPGKWEIWKQG